jgi:hypothetical protein
MWGIVVGTAIRPVLPTVLHVVNYAAAVEGLDIFLLSAVAVRRRIETVPVGFPITSTVMLEIAAAVNLATAVKIANQLEQTELTIISERLLML